MTGRGKYEVLLDAVFCVVAADGRVSKSELGTVVEIFAKMRAPFSKDDIRRALEVFVARVKESGLREVLNETKADVTRHATSVTNRQAFFETLRLVADADGEVVQKEQYVIDELRKAVAANDAPAFDISEMLDEAAGTEERVRAKQFVDTTCPLCGEPTKRPEERICRICAGSHRVGVRSTMSEVPVTDAGDGLLLGRFVLIRGDDLLWRGGSLRREAIERFDWRKDTDRVHEGVGESITLLISRRDRRVVSVTIASFFTEDETSFWRTDNSSRDTGGLIDEIADAVIDRHSMSSLATAKEQIGSLCSKLGIWLVGGEPALRSRSKVVNRPGLSHGIRGDGLSHPLEDAVRDLVSNVKDFFSGKPRRKR